MLGADSAEMRERAVQQNGSQRMSDASNQFLLSQHGHTMDESLGSHRLASVLQDASEKKASIRPSVFPRRVPPAVATRTPTHCLQAPSHFEQAAAGRRRCPPHARDREEREAALNDEKK